LPVKKYREIGVVRYTSGCEYQAKEFAAERGGGPGGGRSLTFVVTDDVENMAEQELKGVHGVRIRDPSVQQVRFCRKRGSGLSFLTFVGN
jgi:hypothetical protein